MTEIDKAIDELIRQMHEINGEITRLNRELTAVTSEIRGLERAKILFSPPESAGRLDVQGPVMAFLESPRNIGMAFSEAVIMECTDLPGITIHKFLLRAVRTGKLVCQDGVYSLPPAPNARAAE